MAILVLSLSLVTAGPELGCSLVVDGRNTLGGSRIESGGFEASALNRASYVLRRGALSARSRSLAPPRLASLTFQPPGAPHATVTCTSDPLSGPAFPSDAAVSVFCVLPDRTLVVGAGSVAVDLGGDRYDASASGTELRLAIQGPTIGFAAAWSNERAPKGNMTTLEVGDRTLTCWRM